MKRVLLLLLVLAASIGLAQAQNRTVSGTVTDAETGAPLPLANVQIKGTTSGTVTDNDGRFTLKVPGEETVLVFFYTGYQTQEVLVAGQTTFNVALKSANEEIDQVVVVGYGTARKTGSTVGNVASVGSEVMEAKPVANPLDALGGRVAGMSVLTSSGEPSQTATILIHGTGSLTSGTAPLYILDGTPVGASTILAMNPNDFKQVDVLKDASATSIYGSRAANGVIFITTKRGEAGDYGDVQVRFSYGWSSLANRKYFDRRMSSEQLLQFFQDLGWYDASDVAYVKDKYGDTDFDWTGYLYASNVPTHQGDITFSGGKGNTTYYISGSYMMSQGLRVGSAYDKYGLRTNINSKVKEWLRVGVNSSVYYDISQRNFWGRTDWLAMPQGLLPWITPYDSTGKEKDYYAYPPAGEDFYTNKYTREKRYDKASTASLVASAYIQLEPIKGLTIRSQAGFDGGFTFQDFNLAASHLDLKGQGGIRSNRAMRYATANIANTIEYKFVVAENHSIIPLIGQEYVRYGSGSFKARAEGLPTDKFNELDNAVDKQRTSMESGGTEYWFNSYFGRLEYNYASRYFVDLSIRNDASSRFSKKHRNALFWSAGLMWKAKNERFLQDVQWLDELTPRFSIGTSGNADIGNYASLSTAAASTPYAGVGGIGLSYAGNPNLTWENQMLISAGVSAGFLKMINVDVSFYKRITTSMLMDVPVPDYLGIAGSEIKDNVGKMSNTGVDVTLEVTPWRDAQKGDYVSIYANYNYNMDRVEELFGGHDYWIMHNYGTAYAVGRPVQFFYPLFYRIDPETGYPQFYEPNPDNPAIARKDPEHVVTVKNGKANDYLFQATGCDRYPHHMGGFGLNASYFGFYVQADFMYVLGKWMISNDEFFSHNPNALGYGNYDKDLINNYWTPDRRDAKYPGKGVEHWLSFDSRLISDASFLRMKNFTVGYSVPSEWLEVTKFFTSAKVYCTLRNFLTVTKYPGPDPEPNINLTLGGNPATRQVVVGVDFKF